MQNVWQSCRAFTRNATVDTTMCDHYCPADTHTGYVHVTTPALYAFWEVTTWNRHKYTCTCDLTKSIHEWGCHVVDERVTNARTWWHVSSYDARQPLAHIMTCKHDADRVKTPRAYWMSNHTHTFTCSPGAVCKRVGTNTVSYINKCH